MTPEGKLQAKIIKHLEKDGFKCIKMIKTSKNWIPDLLVRQWGGKIFWIEVKTETWRTSPLQDFVIKELRKDGDIVLIPYWWDQFLEQYNLI